MSALTVRELCRSARAALLAAGVEDAAFDAALLACHVFHLRREELPLRGDMPVAPNEERRFAALLARRAAREPLQYILGAWPFMDMELQVGPGVLCPRPETELLCRTAVAALPGSPCRVLDLCTGSGAVALGLLSLRPQDTAVAVELSEDAARYARANFARFGAGRVRLSMGNVLRPPAGELAGERFDCIVANPPYIAAAQLPNLQPEVQREPALALNGGADGLQFYRAIVAHWAALLGPHGVLAVEIGEEQAQAVCALWRAAGFSARVERDLAGLDRVVWGERTDAAENENKCS